MRSLFRIPALALLVLTVLLSALGCSPGAQASRAPAAETGSTPRSAAAPREPTPVPDAAAIANAQWEEFLRYGPELTGLVTKSDEISRIHTQGARTVTTATRGQFYNLTNQAAQQTGELKRQSTQVRVPKEAQTFKESVTRTLSQRETAFNKLKESLDKPGAATEGAYQSARQDADGSALRTVAALFLLCDTMGATPDECRATTGLSD